MLRLLLFAAAGLLAVACSSTSKSGKSPDDAIRVGIFDYRTQKLLELVSQSHTERVEQYSKVRDQSEAGRKVQEDEVMRGLADYFDEKGFAKIAQSGAAPRAANEQLYWALELEEHGKVSHVVLTKSLPADTVATCRELKNAFLEIYNHTYGLQAVKVKAGDTPFKTPTTPKKGKQ